eukprot:366067-Chlamydomonas_euryale.AAC.16
MQACDAPHAKGASRKSMCKEGLVRHAPLSPHVRQCPLANLKWSSWTPEFLHCLGFRVPMLLRSWDPECLGSVGFWNPCQEASRPAARAAGLTRTRPTAWRV